MLAQFHTGLIEHCVGVDCRSSYITLYMGKREPLEIQPLIKHDKVALLNLIFKKPIKKSLNVYTLQFYSGKQSKIGIHGFYYHTC